MLGAGKLSRSSDSQHEPWRVAVSTARDVKVINSGSVAESALT